jgi:hypothetical protein
VNTDESAIQMPVTALDSLPAMPWKDKLAFLTYRFLQLPQTECPLEHKFEPGLYIRELIVPAGTLFIGRTHRHGHGLRLVRGDLIQVTEEAKIPLTAPFEMHSTPGFQAVFFTLTEIIGQSIHPNPTESRDTQALEDDAFEPVAALVEAGRIVEQRLGALTWQA